LNPRGRLDDDRGVVLFTAMMFVLIMSIMGAVAYVITANDASIAGNLEVSRKAFYSVDSGVQFGLASIQKALKANTMTLPETEGASVSLSACILPSDPDITDISFEYLPTDAPALIRIAENEYQFTVRGYHTKNADADVRVTFQKRSALKFGVFGDKGFSAPAFSNFYGYNSTVTSAPGGDDGENSCDIGSNQSVMLCEHTEVYGHIGLGRNGAVDAGYHPSGSPEPQIHGPGDAVRAVGPVEPDPLGVSAGVYAQKFSDCRIFSDNGIISPNLILETGQSVTLRGKTGGASYFFSKIELKNGAILAIDTSAGPVHIYLSGELDGKNGTIFHAGGDPKKFAIFSDTADPVSISNASAFYGMIYAPYADLALYNHAAIYGAILAGSIDVKNAGDFYFDRALKDKYLTQDVVMSSWYDVRS
jgi:hypothetical protein